MKRPSGEDYPVYAEAGDIPRIKGTSTEYAFNIYVFDTENKRIKVVRIGSDLTYPRPCGPCADAGWLYLLRPGLYPAGLWRSGKASGTGPHRAGRAGDSGDKAGRRA